MACRAVLSLGSALRSQSTRRKKVRASTTMSFKRLCDDKRNYKCTRARTVSTRAELCCWGSGFSRRQSSLFLIIIIIPFVVNNECASSLLHAWTAARVGAAAARSIPPPHISQPRPPQPQ